jgi:hypothetical protein
MKNWGNRNDRKQGKYERDETETERDRERERQSERVRETE